MSKKFPSIGEYNNLIRQKGGDAFSNLKGIIFTPSRKVPMTLYLHGSGAYAAVFKGSKNGNDFAIRCFLTAEYETIERYKKICTRLESIDSPWKTEFEFLENELDFEGIKFPVLKMRWINGMVINQFVSENIHNNNLISLVQKKLIEISEDLENRNIGHGDLQCGNMIVTGDSNNFQIKLIDYDGMYVSDLNGSLALEKGRSEFQHPKRTMNDFNSKIDRFSIWVFITALEAIKYDKSLWYEVMQGGFNTLDNFLFTSQDFNNPSQSILFQRLFNLNTTSLNFYTKKLIEFCKNNISDVSKPKLYNSNSENIESKSPLFEEDLIRKNNLHFRIISKKSIASVLDSTFQILGKTPLNLLKKEYEGKIILVSNGKETKRIKLNSFDDIIEIEFS